MTAYARTVAAQRLQRFVKPYYTPDYLLDRMLVEMRAYVLAQHLDSHTETATRPARRRHRVRDRGREEPALLLRAAHRTHPGGAAGPDRSRLPGTPGATVIRRVLVTGSRNWPSRAAVVDCLVDLAHQAGGPGSTLTVVHGACPTGADAIAAAWCHHWVGPWPNVLEEPHPADWRPGGRFDASAGFRRNAKMVALGADLVLAFCRAGSRGTMHTVGLARDAGIPVQLVELP